MVVLKDIDPVSLGKIMAVMYAIGGFLEGVIIAFIFVVAGNTGTGTQAIGGPILGAIGIAIVVIAPIVGAIGGFIVGAIGALIYNWLASKIGGIEITLTDKK